MGFASFIAMSLTVSNMEQEEDFTFCRKSLKRNAFSVLENMKQKGKFCDITVKAQGVCMKAHRAILAATIPYFEKKFESSAEEVKSSEITFLGVEPAIMESVIEFAYTGEVRITSGNALALLTAFDFFKLEDIVCACIKYLSTRLCPRNVLQVRTLCIKYDIQDVLEMTDRFVIDNFEKIHDTPSFLFLTCSYLKKILRRDDLNITMEMTVYEAVMRWVRVAPDKRQNFLPELLRAVRIPQLSDDYLAKQVMTEELILSSDSCKKLLFGIKNYNSQRKNILFSNFTARPRIFTVQRQVRLSANPDHSGLYMIVYSDSNAHSVYKCDLQTYEWDCISINNLTNQYGYIYRAVAVNDKICMFLERKIQVFHLKTHKWELLKPLHYYVAGSGICLQNDKIYIFGGCSCGVSGKVRCFDPQNEKWLEDGMMKEHRTDSAAAPLGKFILVTGGHSKGNVRNTVEMYAPRIRKSTTKINSLSSEKCRKISPMLNERCNHGCTALNEKIYVCGGYQGKWHYLVGNESHGEIINTAEVYDPVTNKWNFISSLYRPRTFQSSVSYDQKLYAAGGMTQNAESTFHVEVYDAQLDEWDFCPQTPNYGAKSTYNLVVTVSSTYDETEISEAAKNNINKFVNSTLGKDSSSSEVSKKEEITEATNSSSIT